MHHIEGESSDIDVTKGSSLSGRRVMIASLVSALIAGPIGINVRKKMKNKREITSQKLVYSEVLGWVDMGHANPSGALVLIDKVSHPQRIPESNVFGEVEYAQYQRMGKLSTGVKKKYIVPLRMNPSERESVAFTIFLRVSRAFEEHQEYTDWFSDSAFSEADLIGNVIGFYRASRGYTDDEIKKLLRIKTPEEALHLFEQRNMGKNTKIGWVPCPEDPENYVCKYPTPFNMIRTVRLGKFYSGRVLLQELLPRNNVDGITFSGYTPSGLEKFRLVQPKKFYALSPNEQRGFLSQLGEKYKKVQWMSSADPNTIILYY